MTRNDIAKSIAGATGLKQEEVKRVVRMLLDEIIDSIVDEGRIELRGFGVFEVRMRKPRKALNPRTKETVRVPEKKVVRFRAGKLMGKRVAGGSDISAK